MINDQPRKKPLNRSTPNRTINNQPINDQIKKNKTFDLEERTAQFGEKIIDLAKKLPDNSINKRLIPQLAASGGSIGANYCEATEAESKRDFQHKISICKKEIKETKHWIRLLARANPKFKEEFRKLWQEAQELLLIFSKCLETSKKGKKK
jgi:four helix bundle protein